ncbi:MAG: hypothetical protein EBY36_12270, partial [Gammaproteobacteria bacterium]|nr:hypothetical protein [Gammaproteobacteria bacterium]
MINATARLISLTLLMFACMLAAPALQARADQNDPRLNDLFAELKTQANQERADAITGEIWSIWREIDDPASADALEKGVRAMSSRQYRTAYQYFTEVIERSPDFAEGWNKRATLLYLVDSYDESIQDIKETLRREPRHFGALSGLGLIFLKQHQFGP